MAMVASKPSAVVVNSSGALAALLTAMLAAHWLRRGQKLCTEDIESLLLRQHLGRRPVHALYAAEIELEEDDAAGHQCRVVAV